jgi:arabinose-5-phosphate isomerase
MDAVMAMTKAQSGSALVADGSGRLLGIFTDGDFRRAFSSASSPSSLIPSTPVSSRMTSSPLFVHDDVYAADLLKIFERRHIDDLPVCDGEGRVVGLVDIQDLPKMKVL